MLANAMFLVLVLLLNLWLVVNTVAQTAEEETSTKCQEGLVLITGGTGNIGSLTTKMLLKQGFCVRILTRNTTKANEKFANLFVNEQHTDGLEFVRGDLGDNGASVKRAFEATASLDNANVSHLVFAAGGDDADFDAVIEPVPTCVSDQRPPRYESVTCGDRKFRRYAASFPHLEQ